MRQVLLSLACVSYRIISYWIIQVMNIDWELKGNSKQEPGLNLQLWSWMYMHLWAQTNKHYEKETPGTRHPPKHKYTFKCICCCLTQCRSKTCLLLRAGSGPGLFVWHRYSGRPNRVVNLQYDTYHEGIRQMWPPFDKRAQRCALKSSVFLSSPSFAQLSPSFQQIWEWIYSYFMHWYCSSHSEE